jgi:hypothetical protein
MSRTFDYYRSVNTRLFNLKNQDDQYQKYVKRVDKIVERKYLMDTSVIFYQTQHESSKEKAKKKQKF